MAAAFKEMGIEDEVASEWSDSEESDAAQEMTEAEYKAVRADGSTLSRNTETRWVPFQPPIIKKELHHCAMCDYKTNVLTKASKGMPRHKAVGQWCRGSGQAPGRSETLHETEDPHVRVYTWGACDAILDGKAPRHAVRFCSME